MTTTIHLKCTDFLKDNPRLYAFKARRKKIALIHLEAENKGSDDVKLDLSSGKLFVGSQPCAVESPEVILRKFSEFTWDFAIYAILDFHPVLLALDVLVFLTGPLYNRRVKRQLQSLADGELVLRAGERKHILLGFRGVSRKPDRLEIPCSCNDGQRRFMQDPPLQDALVAAPLTM